MLGPKFVLKKKKSIFEWNFIIEKTYNDVCIGICDSSMTQLTEWLLCSNGTIGTCYNNNIDKLNYCPSFRDGAKITVHLDMIKKILCFYN